jgi:hypothetical protein
MTVSAPWQNGMDAAQALAGSVQKSRLVMRRETTSAAASSNRSPFSALAVRGSPIAPCEVRDLNNRQVRGLGAGGLRYLAPRRMEIQRHDASSRAP